MSVTFPKDSADKAGAIRINPDGNSFHVPIVTYAPDGVTPISETKPMAVSITGNSTLKGAVINVTTSGSRVQLPNYPCHEVTIIAKRNNSGFVYIGGSDVSNTVFGIDLAAKDSITLAVSNTNLIFIDASVNGEGISYFSN